MKITEIFEKIAEKNPVAIVVISDENDQYTTTTYGRICQDKVVEILQDIVDQWEAEQAKYFDDIKDQLPF